MSKSPSLPDVQQAIDRAIDRIRAYGIDGPRPIEEIEAVMQHGDFVAPALAAAVEAAEKTRLVAAIHLVALLKSRAALPAVSAAAFDAPAPLAAKSEALAAHEGCGEKPPGETVDRFAAAEDFLAAPTLAGIETVLAWPAAWRAPVLEAWLDRAGAEQIDLVAELLGREEALDADLLGWLGAHASERAVEIVREYLSMATEKERVKDAKRALHKLKSKGLTVESSTEPDGEGAFTLAVDAHTPSSAQAYITSVDGQGSQLLWILWPSASGGYRLLQAVVEEGSGLTKADLIRVSRNEFRAHLERLRSNPALLLGRIDVHDAARQLAAAARQSATLGSGPPAAYEEWAKMAAGSGMGAQADVASPPMRIYERVDVDEVKGRSDLIDAAMELLREPFFSSWVVTGDAVSHAVDEIREAERSTLMINDEQRQARMQDALRQAVENSFDDATRALYRRRLEVMSDMLWDERGEAAARNALAAAVGFTEIDDLFGRHAFARALVHRGVWLLYQERARRDAAEQRKTGVIRP